MLVMLALTCIMASYVSAPQHRHVRDAHRLGQGVGPGPEVGVPQRLRIRQILLVVGVNEEDAGAGG